MMKRYLVLGRDFDFRANMLNLSTVGWSEDVKKNHKNNTEILKKGILNEFGNEDIEGKIKRFKQIGAKPFSIISYHNALLDQVRSSYVQGNYYPALVGACTLGERILNHLVLDLRGYYAERFGEARPKQPIWKHSLFLIVLRYLGVNLKEADIFADKNFINWNLMINNLVRWSVIDKNAADLFRKLSKKRHKSIHFSESTVANLESESFEAVDTLQKIIQEQFPAFHGDYFIPGLPEAYLKKELESQPFFIKYYIPNSKLVSPYNKVKKVIPTVTIEDNFNGENKNVTDDEFAQLRKKARDTAEKSSKKK